MTDDKTPQKTANSATGTIESAPKPAAETGTKSRKKLSPPALRALEEAAARRKAAEHQNLPKEINGPKGPEPTRYGDWEKKGVTSDF